MQRTIKHVSAYSLLFMGITAASLALAAPSQSGHQTVHKPETWAEFIEHHPMFPFSC
jgi:hypothetical protein